MVNRYASTPLNLAFDLSPIEAITPSNFNVSKNYKSVTLSLESCNWRIIWAICALGCYCHRWLVACRFRQWTSWWLWCLWLSDGSVKSSFVVFDGSYGGINDYFEPHSGTQMTVSFYSNSAPNNDWIITPQLTIATGDYLELFARTANDVWGLEEMRVLISENTSNTGDFIKLHPETTLEVPSTWTNYSYDLSAYAGKKVYLAINCVSNDKYALLIDDIKLKNINNSYAPLTAQSQNHTSTPLTSGNIEYQIVKDGAVIKTLNGFENYQYTNEANLCKEYSYSIQTNYISPNVRSNNSSLTVATCREITVEVKSWEWHLKGHW